MHPLDGSSPLPAKHEPHPQNMTSEQPTGAQKRGFYVLAFCVAFAIDLLLSWSRGVPYTPTLVGLAIMITAVLYFAWSWFRER